MFCVDQVSIIGAGNVGAACASALLATQLFRKIILMDINRQRAQGEAMDLSHAAAFFPGTQVRDGGTDDCAGSELIVFTAGAAQKPDETRIDLVNKNVKIFKSIIPEIVKRNTEGILLVVSNPVDILTYVTFKLSGFPTNRVIGSGTVLDTARLKYLLGEHLQVDSRSIHAFIIGEHGDSELAVWSSANVSGVDLNHFCELRGHYNHMEAMERIYTDVRDSAYEIIEKKGATYYGIAMAVRRICESIIRNEHSILPISSLICGHYGLEDVCMGVPTVVGRNGAETVLDIPLNGLEQRKLMASADALRKVLDGIAL